MQLKSSLVTSAFIEGKSASCIDLDGAWSTFANKFFDFINKSKEVINGGIRVKDDFHILLKLLLKVSIKQSHF